MQVGSVEEPDTHHDVVSFDDLTDCNARKPVILIIVLTVQSGRGSSDEGKFTLCNP